MYISSYIPHSQCSQANLARLILFFSTDMTQTNFILILLQITTTLFLLAIVLKQFIDRNVVPLLPSASRFQMDQTGFGKP